MEANRRTSDGRRGRPIQFEMDGVPVQAYEGETILAALVAAGHRVLRHTARRGTPRGFFCGMGVCFDCTVTVDDIPDVQACVTPVEQGMKVQTQHC